MEPAFGFGVIALLVLALILVHWSIRRQRVERARRRAIRKAANSSLSARALDDAYAVLGPTTRREVQDTIPTIDEHGNRHFLIRTRELETVLGPVGPLEVERQQRLTLPGHGHVHALSDTEFEVFHNHMRLRVDVNERL